MQQVRSEEIPDVRAALRQRRRDFDGAARVDAEAAIVGHLLSLLDVANATSPGRVSASAYLACDGEVGLTDLIETMHALSRSLALPALVRADDPDASGSTSWQMEFRRFGAGDALRTGAFDIVEPADGDPVEPAAIDVVFAALVAFDSTGARIGRGGGHYDRSFGPTRRLERRPLLVGVGFEFQRVGCIATRPHDVDMDLIVSELGIRWTGDQSTEGRTTGARTAEVRD